MSDNLKHLHEQIEQLRNAFNPNLLSDVLNGFLQVLDGSAGSITRPESQIVHGENKLTQDQMEKKMALAGQSQWLEPNCVCCDVTENTKIDRLPSSTMEEARCGRCNHEQCMPKEWYIDQVIHGAQMQALFNSGYRIWELGNYIPFAEWYQMDGNQQLIENVVQLQSEVPEENFNPNQQ
jgi:hypothetical protein